MLVGRRSLLLQPVQLRKQCHLCIYLPCVQPELRTQLQDFTLLQGMTYKYLQSAEELQGLSVWVQELSVI